MRNAIATAGHNRFDLSDGCLSRRLGPVACREHLARLVGGAGIYRTNRREPIADPLRRDGERCYTFRMRATIAAEVDEQGNLPPDEPLNLLPGARVLITVVDPDRSEAALLSEVSLSVDSNRPEEDAAWSHVAQAT